MLSCSLQRAGSGLLGALGALPAAAAGCGRLLHQQQQARQLHAPSGSPAALQAVSTRPGPQMQPSWLALALPQYKAVLIDAAGTLVLPTERTAEVYLRYGRAYGVSLSEEEVLQRFRW